MKSSSLRLSGSSIALALVSGALSPLQAAPADNFDTAQKTSLSWLGIKPDDELSRAATVLEAALEAEKTATRRLAQGEITPKELDATSEVVRRAKQRLKELLALKKATHNSGKETPVAFLLADATTTPVIPVPFLATLPPQNPKGSTTPLLETTVAGNTMKSTVAPVASLLSTPRVTALNHASQGSITAPGYGSRQMLHAPHKAGARQLFAFVARLPQNKSAVTDAKATNPVISVPSVTPAVAPVLKATKPEPKAVKPQAKIEPKNDSRNSGFSNAELQRLAKLEAELSRADRRLNAANQALSDGQEQLNRFAGTLRQAMLEAGPDAIGLHPFVKVAEKYAGTPYVWGGESRRGFDCSGMIIRVMRDLGYKALPHSAAEQYKYGKPIAQPLLKPGDLVFFANTYKAGISHVGIYLGKRRFIHAAGTGKGTIVSSLDESKFQSKYAGARRLIAARN